LYNTPLGVYRQTYHSTSEGVRDPSESELRLLTSAPLAFNAKYITDFTYNSGASPMYGYAGNSGGNATFYNYVAEANRQARNLGPALVRLKPVASAPDHTTNIMIVRGKHDIGGGSFAYNDIPGYSGFVVDPQSQQYTDWTFTANDPYLSGFTSVTNNGTKNSSLQGDMLISWFQPLDEWMDGDDWTNEKYLMIVNGLADMNGTAADCKQTIVLDFNNNTNTQVIQTLDPNGNGAVTDVSLPLISTKRRYTLTLDGGSSMLLKFKDGAPFVGTMPPDAIWKNSSGGAFSTGGNWDVNTAPSGNYFLHFGTITGGAGPAYTASLNSSLSVKGAFVHNDNVTWNLGGATLTLTGFAGVDSLIVGMRSGEFGSLTLSNGTLFVVNPTGFFSEIGKAAGATGVLTVGNGAAWINNGTLLIGKAGAGTLNVMGTGNISATNIYVGGSGTSAGGSGVVKLSGGSLNVSGTLKIWNNGTVSVTSGVTPPRVAALTISGGTLDLSSGFIVDYTGSSPLATLKPQLLTGFNNGAWTGPGITSTHAATIAADSSNLHKTAVGYLDTSAFSITSFMGQTVDTTSLLFRYTFTGDANLDGQVNSADFTRLSQNFNQSGKDWWDGDANFDGKVNALDFNLLASNFGQVMPSRPMGALVPEPVSLLCLTGVLFLARRARSKFAC
jgi:T5SS/PEP-CTERM-associated repeat protein